MSQIIHNISFPNDGNGDELRTAFENQNLNNTELYTTKVDKVIGKELSSNDFTNAEKSKLASLNVNAEQNVQADFLQNDPLADGFIKNKPVGMLASVGYFDYNDTATNVTPLVLVSNVEKKLTNDTLGAFTRVSGAPYGVSSIWNSATNQFNFSQLSVDDTLDFRVDCELETQSANQTYTLYLRIGVGTISPVDIVLYRDSVKTAVSLPNGTNIIGNGGIYLGGDLYKNAPAELYIKTDGGGKLQVNGWYVRIIRKGLNVATILGDNLKLDKVTTSGVERVYTINPDGTQGTKATSALGGNNNLVFKDLTNGINVVNNPNFVERYAYGCLIPANTIKAGDVVNIECSFDYVSGGSSEAFPIIAINTIDAIAGWTVIGRYNSANGYKNARMQRTLSVKTVTNTEFSYSGGQTNPTAFGQGLFVYGGNIDWTINQYIILGLALNGATDAVWRKSTIIITKN